MSGLEVHRLSAGYGDLTVVRDIDLEVDEGGFVVLVGANGAGKSTLLRTISGLINPSQGEIRLMGQRIDHLMPHQVVEMGFVQAPEGKQLFLEMTVQDNLLVGSYNRRARKSRTETLEQVYELFPILNERRHLFARTLSGGEQQMLAVGRAMMAQPRLLALDEPSLGLAPILVDRLFDTIKRIWATGLTLLLVEQNVQQALEMADRGYVLENGRIVLGGRGQDLLQDEHLKTHYLGI
jgi:branched-chain amino acid transport system ATP-binding protein